MSAEVWIVEGWFGDLEWIEAIYANQDSAEARAEELNAERRSFILPADHWAQRLCKFAAVCYEVLP